MGDKIERDIAAIRLRDEIREIRGGYKNRKLPPKMWEKILRLTKSYSLVSVSSFLEVSSPGIRRHQRAQSGGRQSIVPVPDPAESWIEIPLGAPSQRGSLRGVPDIALELGFSAYGQVRIEMNQAGCSHLAQVLRDLRQ